MGRLFWKFFSVFWLAQFATFLVAGLMFVAHPPQVENFHDERPTAAASALSGTDEIDRHHPERKLPPPPMLVAAVLVSLASAAWLSWYFSRPIRSLNAAFDALADGNLDTRVGSAMGSRRDELADLGQAFDRSAVKLQALVETQRRLLHDVSHELRSPLARLQACADLMVQQPHRSAELVMRVERETARMDTLVGELLTLARLDSGAQQLRNEVVDLGDLLRTLCADAQLELESKQCTLELNVQSAVTLQGDFELLYRALDNILRNAIRYAPGGSSIAVGLRKHTNLPQATLTIADRGPGLPTEDIGAIFEPFYRSAQNSGHTERSGDQGYGLGLTITRSIVQSHGGTVVAQSRPGGGLEMHVTFPLVPH
jgi:signal transduction histidine kinase